MTIQLVRRRTFWVPTLAGWLGLFVLIGTLVSLWWFQGESFLAKTLRQPAEVLVVEGWIGIEGVKAAKTEFDQGGYEYIVATSGLSGNVWDLRRWTLASEAEELLLRAGLPKDRVILAIPRETDEHRTYESALASRQALAARGIHPRAINVFTLGVHARRSRLVYAKVFSAETPTGVIAWTPTHSTDERWWRSSSRAGDFLKETVGYLLELLFDSGRGFTSKPEPTSNEAKGKA